MCGICGIAATRGAVDRERLVRMSATLVHRGPDSEGMHLDGGIGVFGSVVTVATRTIVVQ